MGIIQPPTAAWERRDQPAASPLIHVFIGTKAQYIKTAPLLRIMDERQVPYRLIDSGQHAALASSMRGELRVREPDYRFGSDRDITSVGAAIAWSLRCLARLRSGRRLRREVFGGRGGICVVHGDTPSTLISTLLARRAGLEVAHLEAGLRSHNVLSPFPEELIRIVVMRLSTICFAPTPDAVQNLENMSLSARVVPLSGNTSIEAFQYSASIAGQDGDGSSEDEVVITMHRVENLKRPSRVRGWVQLAVRIARTRPTLAVLHEPTRATLESLGLLDRLREAGIRIVPLMEHGEFIARLQRAPFVVIDGGSIQEECAYIGVPTLLWRDHTERPHGLDSNVVLSGYDPAVVDPFLADPDQFRTATEDHATAPSEEILAALIDRLPTTGR